MSKTSPYKISRIFGQKTLLWSENYHEQPGDQNKAMIFDLKSHKNQCR